SWVPPREEKSERSSKRLKWRESSSKAGGLLVVKTAGTAEAVEAELGGGTPRAGAAPRRQRRPRPGGPSRGSRSCTRSTASAAIC
ncbi:unnamed protein product, partial [Musa hybrid cultivar]